MHRDMYIEQQTQEASELINVEDGCENCQGCSNSCKSIEQELLSIEPSPETELVP